MSQSSLFPTPMELMSLTTEYGVPMGISINKYEPINDVACVDESSFDVSNILM